MYGGVYDVSAVPLGWFHVGCVAVSWPVLSRLSQLDLPFHCSRVPFRTSFPERVVIGACSVPAFVRLPLLPVSVQGIPSLVEFLRPVSRGVCCVLVKVCVSLV